jgi:lipoprotein-anchoring transpeptidase ErfK/SrfK
VTALRAISRSRTSRTLGAARIAALTAIAALARAEGAGHAAPPVPPWTQPGDLPLPAWARSVVPQSDELGHPRELALYSGASRASPRRGVAQSGASLPFFGEKRGPGCSGPWWLVGPWAWACSDDAVLSPASAEAPASGPLVNGLALRYFFVGPAGASAYSTLEGALEGTEDQQLEAGWAVGGAEERTTASDERWVRTARGLWIARRYLVPAQPSSFHGEALEGGRLDVAWIVADRAQVWPSPSRRAKPGGTRSRFDRVILRAEADSEAAPKAAGARMLQIDDGAWVLARDVARPIVSAPPPEVTGPSERWIDVDTSSQTLVAYEGPRPVYATLVSTGRGAAGSDTATPIGVHRVWVKLSTSDMDNVERDDVSQHYSMQDVPFVQFFAGSVALHGTYWHRDFGRPHSHGCVNLAPIDALWLFDFTEPRLPAGWFAVLPTPATPATVVRVR